MTICATCGNDYDYAFTVTWPDGRSATFDGIFCCAHCALKDTNADVNDRYPVPSGA